MMDELLGDSLHVEANTWSHDETAVLGAHRDRGSAVDAGRQILLARRGTEQRGSDTTFPEVE